jgi:hypothetical protein
MTQFILLRLFTVLLPQSGFVQQALTLKTPSMSAIEIYRQWIESDAGDEDTSILCNFEQTLDCRCRHDMCEQTFGGGLFSKRLNSKESGAFCFGKKAYNRVSPNLLWHHGDASHFKKCAILTRRPIQAWCNLARWPKELYGPPPFVVLFLRPEGAMRPPSDGSAGGVVTPGVRCAIFSKARATFLLST